MALREITIDGRPSGAAKVERREDLLCSGLLLTDRHILTIRHAVLDWPDATPLNSSCRAASAGPAMGPVIS